MRLKSRTAAIAQWSWWRRVSVAGAFGLPVLLMAVIALNSGDANPWDLLSNGLYWAAPYGVVFLVHKFGPFVRSTFLTPALLAVSGVLLVFWCWIWWIVPWREGPIAWLLYPPACAAVLLLVWMVTSIHAHLRERHS